jgi:hypothetical protein
MANPPYEGSQPIPALAGDLSLVLIRSANTFLKERGLASGGPYSEVIELLYPAALEIAKWALAGQQTSKDFSTPSSDV